MKTYLCDIPGCGALDAKCVELINTPRIAMIAFMIPILGNAFAFGEALKARSFNVCQKHWKEMLALGQK